jgi:hypothetical protein
MNCTTVLVNGNVELVVNQMSPEKKIPYGKLGICEFIYRVWTEKDYGLELQDFEWMNYCGYDSQRVKRILNIEGAIML